MRTTVEQERENPLKMGLRLDRSAPPCTVVIFGASGDLTRRKLIPALFNLFERDLLASGFSVLGSSRSPMDQQKFRQEMRESMEEHSDGEIDDNVWKSFSEGLFYEPSDPSDPPSYDRLLERLHKIDQERGTSGNRLFYLSTPPSVYADIVARIGEKELTRSQTGWTRIVVEKPFGRDYASARELNQLLQNVFSEEQIYRIDHYLGKETVQNILALRFANGIFEPLWNRRYIDHVQITAAESMGVEDRGGYYEQAGALRDMIQNHLFQLFTLVTMEPPVSLESESVRDEKTKVLRAVRPLSSEQVPEYAVRGQYAEGSVGGRRVRAYQSEDRVDPASRTETFAALKLYVDNWRWAEVPFFLRSGKRLPRRVSEIAIQFRRAPHLIFTESDPYDANTLVLRIQPDEGISLKFRAKMPGQSFHVRPVNMDFQYGASFGKRSADAYERLLLDAMLGDPTLFSRSDMVEISWKILMPVLEAWESSDQKVPLYPAGSWGPREADHLIGFPGRRWRMP